MHNSMNPLSPVASIGPRCRPCPDKRPHALPRPLIWLGVLVGAYDIVSDPIQLVINHSPAGATGPISVVPFLVWILAAAAVMLVKPVWNAKPRPAVFTEASPAC